MKNNFQKILNSTAIALSASTAFLAASEDAEARTRHRPRGYARQIVSQWQSAVSEFFPQQKQEEPSIFGGGSASRGSDNGSGSRSQLIYRVSSGQLELDGRSYAAGSGNREGFNNPSYGHVNNRGPVPQGNFSVSPRGGAFHGQEAWRINGTFNRAGILIHSDDIRLKGRPYGESLGCIAVKGSQYEQFRQDMHRLRPSSISIVAN